MSELQPFHPEDSFESIPINNVSSTQFDNIYSKPCQILSTNIVELVQNPLKNAKNQLEEIQNKQTDLIDKLHSENLDLARAQHDEVFQTMFVKMKIYSTKLRDVKRDIRLLHERSQKLKRRALKLQELKEMEPKEEIIVSRATNLIGTSKGGGSL